MVMTLMSNPKGAVGTVVVAADGSGDTTDIQTAIDLLPATGGCVYIKEGTYNITATITVEDNVSIIGCGFSTEIIAIAAVGSMFNIPGDNVITNKFRLINFQAIAGTDICINVTGDNFFSSEIGVENTSDGIVLNGTTNAYLYACYAVVGGIFGAGWAVRLTGAIRITIDNCNFEECSNGVWLEGNGNIITASIFGGATGVYTAAAATSTNNMIIGCNFESCNRNGIWLDNEGDARNIISNNVFNTCCSDVTNSVAAIRIEGDDCVIEGNVVNETTYGDGIYITGDNCIVKGNRVINCARNGIYIHTTADRTIVGDNRVSNSVTTNIDDSGTNTQIGHNLTS